jgi:hypothetical protein
MFACVDSLSSAVSMSHMKLRANCVFEMRVAVKPCCAEINIVEQHLAGDPAAVPVGPQGCRHRIAG